MEIHNHGKNLNLHFNNQNSKTSNQVGELAAGNGADRIEQVKPQRLIERLEGDAKVRETLLVEIEAKVQAGEYLTRSAAVEAAEQIVD